MIRVKNWSSYQSYKDRKPPWIRLHKTLLDNYEFQRMSVNARALLPMIWLLASEDEDPTSGLIGASYEKIAFRLRLNPAEVEASVKEMADAEFVEIIQPCIETVTKPYTVCTDFVTPETETEKEKDISAADAAAVSKRTRKPKTEDPLAVEVYEHYCARIVNVPGKRADAIRNITRRLKEGYTVEQLGEAIDAYKESPEFRPDTPYHPNNFYGQKSYFIGFIPRAESCG